MTTPDAKRIADRYIGADGEETIEDKQLVTLAEKAWREHAESVNGFLRAKLKTESTTAYALAAFERIGDAIAEDEKRGRR